ncbi:MAG: DUF421 domain-containing protein [Bacillota bacterium]
MLHLVYRTVFVYFVVLLVVRLMGKRQIGQLSPFDLVVAIIVAEIAAMPMQSASFPIWHSIVPLAVLALLEVGLSFAALYSRRLRVFLDGKPQVVIEDGRILKKELRKARYNLDDLLAQLREKGFSRPEDIEVAVLETSGRLSVVPRDGKRAVTPEDLGLKVCPEGVPEVLVMDGEIFEDNLRARGLDRAWLEGKLDEMGLKPRDVFFATMERDGGIRVNLPETESKKNTGKKRNYPVYGRKYRENH